MSSVSQMLIDGSMRGKRGWVFGGIRYCEVLFIDYHAFSVLRPWRKLSCRVCSAILSCSVSYFFRVSCESLTALQ